MVRIPLGRAVAVAEKRFRKPAVDFCRQQQPYAEITALGFGTVPLFSLEGRLDARFEHAGAGICAAA